MAMTKRHYKYNTLLFFTFLILSGLLSITLNNNVIACTDSHLGFEFSLPSNWTDWGLSGTCGFFTPNQGKTFPDLSPSATYVRITRTNLSMPISSIQDLADNVLYFTDKGFYKLLSTPIFVPLNKIHSYALILNYSWQETPPSLLNYRNPTFGPPRVTLPFVNDSSSFTSVPTGTSQASSAANNTSPGTEQPSPANNTSPSKPPSKLPSKLPPVQLKAPQSIDQQTMAIYIINDNKVYVIEYNAPQAKFKDHLQEINQMVNSFAFVSPTNSSQNKR